jgi:hypothetical protein
MLLPVRLWVQLLLSIILVWVEGMQWQESHRSERRCGEFVFKYFICVSSPVPASVDCHFAFAFGCASNLIPFQHHGAEESGSLFLRPFELVHGVISRICTGENSLLFQLLSLHSARFAFRYHFTYAFVFASRDSLYVQMVEN